MKTSTSQEKHGIQWTTWMQLNSLSFADDPALLCHTKQQIQVMTVWQQPLQRSFLPTSSSQTTFIKKAVMLSNFR
ncbi:unnamed protein product [Schistosoma margrebowiei]|uniref:Uncharacterized protein n=1 Tax=Schistosoma margrebowiei TaxID=48269 RepID=A0A183LCY5_9TREM|nr:unnamed protein product [Schistosoma margrebowiei]